MKRTLRAVGLVVAVVALMAFGGAAPASADDAPPRPELPPVPDRGLYLIQADLVICEDETGETNVTSDELTYKFVSDDAQQNQVFAEQSFGDVDSGETHLFGQQSPHVLLDLTAPTGAGPPVTLNVQLIERDTWPNPDDVLGTATLKWSREEIHAVAPTLGSSDTVHVPTFTGDNSSYVTQLRITRVA